MLAIVPSDKNYSVLRFALCFKVKEASWSMFVSLDVIGEFYPGLMMIFLYFLFTAGVF